MKKSKIICIIVSILIIVVSLIILAFDHLIIGIVVLLVGFWLLSFAIADFKFRFSDIISLITLGLLVYVLFRK